ncbi:B12-binding domain-containing radical SAM protein [Anaerosporobacter faecicola]|uniref:B12-binding domain-containing radical SAM protein n=1 Tax=Anaerosporobacter faecicola TaxID=2718714 RepID=UPI00143972DF|nr:B12-binding domain-containing radical SAM protein [Anaerosporobacter faecicola]
MKVLLTAINAKYIHSNLAIFCLQAYAKKYRENIELAEFTINHYTDYIIQEIYKKKPDVLAVSCYIWNIDMVEEVLTELHKLLPDMKIWLGGPEVSYDAKERMKRIPFLTGIMIGEGEETFLELMEHYVDHKGQLGAIRGIAYRELKQYGQVEIGNDSKENTEMDIIVTLPREQMDLSKVPFPYEDMEQFKNKIIYYESSRGCPYSCSYCLSSIDKRVRFRSLDLVRKELKIFLDHKIPQVKFVDRTFNCNREHTMAIWRFIHENDNGITNFHFEISADILTEDELALLGQMRQGLVQLEIGVQSTNEQTIHAIQRKMNLDKLKQAVDRVNAGHNIHQHLDLIAGLPYEDYSSFRNSFNDVYAMRPNQLQLGFLKVLKGSAMYGFSQKNTIVYKNTAPYEVLFTQWLSYDEVLQLKQVEDMVEVYHNSGQFTYSIQYVEHFFETPFDFYQELGKYYEEQGLNARNHTRMSRYEILLSFMQFEKKGDENVLKAILLYDLYLRENLKSKPEFISAMEVEREIYHHFFVEEELVKEYVKGYESYSGKQISRLTHLEKFAYNIEETAQTGVAAKAEEYILFDYQNRNPLDHGANTIRFQKVSGDMLRIIES